MLRLSGFHDGLYQDELLSLAEVRDRSLGRMLDIVANGGLPGHPVENNPPLFFVLAWLSAKLASPTAWIRLPSLVLGTATVPLVFLLGVRSVGQRAALVAAGFVALSPFAIFYGVEARAYATLMFLSCLSALILLWVVEAPRRRWPWLVYGASLAAVLYSHYTGVFVIAAQGAWVLWYFRSRWRELVLAYAAGAVAFLPWLPHLRDVGAGPTADVAHILGIGYGDALVQWLVGYPDLTLGDMPSAPALALLGAGVVVGGVGWLVALAGRSPRLRTTEAPVALVFLLAFATPVCLLVYGAVGNDLFLFPRNLSASLPFVALALGVVLTPPTRLALVGAVALVSLGLAIAAARTLDDRFDRPDFPRAAQLLDDRAGPHESVVYWGGGLQPFVLGEALGAYYDRRHTIRGADLQTGSIQRTLESTGGQTFVVAEARGQAPSLPPVAGWLMAEPRVYPGIEYLTVTGYVRLGPNSYAIRSGSLTRSGAAPIPIEPGRMRGAIDGAVTAGGELTLSGWATNGHGKSARRVLAFAGGRVLGGATPGQSPGFQMVIRGPAVDRPETIRVYAIGDGVASQLACTASVRQLIGCQG